MNIYILDQQFQKVAVIDSYESFIWTERYFEAGDFELYMPIQTSMLSALIRDNFVQIKDSDTIMIIESVDIKTDSEKGMTATVSGKSLESILNRRIIWDRTTIDDNIQNGIKKLITENAINPTNNDRKIPGLIFKDSTDNRITSLYMEAYYYGENLYETISSLCVEANIGFKMRTNSDGGIVFELYKGFDRTYDQTDRPFVAFSPEFDNILTSQYCESNEKLKNCALVSNEVPEKTSTDENGTTITTPAWFRTVEVKPAWYVSGMGRREVFYDTSVSDTDEEGNPLSENKKLEQMKTAGLEELAGANVSAVFDAEIDATRQFIYGVDFFIGDVVRVKNEYGYESKARITEFIRSSDANGESTYPTFTVIENLK